VRAVLRVLLVRHAQSEWNAEGRWQGWADPLLTELGERQAAAAGAGLPFVPDVWLASDLRRAGRTAALLGGGDRVVAVADLREYDAGAWTGMRRAEIEVRWPEELAEWDADRRDAVPEGEQSARFVARLQRGLRTAVGVASEAGAAGALVVSHGRAIHALGRAWGIDAFYVSHLAGLELRAGSDNGSVEVVGPVDLLPAGLRSPRRRAVEPSDGHAL
jgi:broad specificity phosphatase PhoE